MPTNPAIEQLAAALRTNADDVDYVQLFADAANISQKLLRQKGLRNLLKVLRTPTHELGKERVYEVAEVLGEYIVFKSPITAFPSFQVVVSVVSQVLFERLPELKTVGTLDLRERETVLQNANAVFELNAASPLGEAAQAVINELAQGDLEKIHGLYNHYLKQPDKSRLKEGAAIIQEIIEKRDEFQARYPFESENHEVIQGWIEELQGEQQDLVTGSVMSQVELLPKKIHSVWIGGSLTGNKANILGQWAMANPDYRVNLWYDSDALLANLLREAINEEIDRVLPPLSADDDPRVYQRQRIRVAKPVYDKVAQWLRENPGDKGRSLYLTEVYRDFLLNKFRLAPSTSEEQLIEAIEDYRTKSLWELQGTTSRIGVQLRDIRTELWPNFQNAAFYEETLGLYGGHLGVASDIARMRILAQEGGLYTDVDIAPEKPLGDYYLSPQLAQFLPIQTLLDGKVVNIAFPTSTSYITIQNPLIVSHKNGTLINLLADQLAQSYERYLQQIETIHNLSAKKFATEFTLFEALDKVVDQLAHKILKLNWFEKLRLFDALKVSTEYYNQFTEEGAITEWEGGPARLLRRKLNQQLDYLNEWQKPLQELRETDTSGLTEEELAAHETRLEELQETLASHYKEAAWKAFRQVTAVDPTTGHIASEDEERAILAELDERFQDVSPEYLPYETRRAVLEAYNKGILPIPYGVEAIPFSSEENLLERFEQEVAIHLAALDLYRQGGGEQTEALATLGQNWELELGSGAPVDHQRLLSLVRQVETHISSNPGLVSLVKGLTRLNLLEGLITYIAGELVYEGINVYEEVLVVVDLAGLTSGEALEQRLALALEATLEAGEEDLPAQEFLRQEATTESPGYRFFYSEEGLYGLLQKNLPTGVSLGSVPDLVQGLQALANQDLDIPSVLEPVFSAISEGLVKHNLWGQAVNRSLTTLAPEARLKLASALGFKHLQLVRSVVSGRETLLTEEFLDQVAVYKLLTPEVLQKELARGNEEEVVKVLQRVAPETLQVYVQQFGQNLHGTSYDPDSQVTLVTVFELATDSQKVILARSLLKQYQLTQNEFLLPVLEQVEAEAILQEQLQIQEYEQYINSFWSNLNKFLEEQISASPSTPEEVVEQSQLQQLEAGLVEDLQESVDQENLTHLWEQELSQELQDFQAQIEAITGESVFPVDVLRDQEPITGQEPTLPPDFVRLPLDEAIVALYDRVVGTSDTQVDGNIQPASERTLAHLVITKIETEFDYGLSRSLKGVFESAEENFAQKDTWLRVLKAVKSGVTSEQ